jgi:glyoxylase-like metal-dependent hydrolase (beta-lactamase superfamily II)
MAPGVWRLGEFPRPLINVYLAEDVLIDAGRRWDARRIANQIDGIELSMVALTHVHPDHQGCAKRICDEREIPLACHEADVDAMEGRWRRPRRRWRSSSAASGRARRAGSTAPCARVTRSLASASSTPPAMPPAR